VAISGFDPDVWSGRALQEVFVKLAGSGLASMYPAFDWSCCAPGHYDYLSSDQFYFRVERRAVACSAHSEKSAGQSRNMAKSAGRYSQGRL